MNQWVNPSDAWLRSTSTMLDRLPPLDLTAPRRVYLDKGCEIFCLVSAEDYEFVTQWRWKGDPPSDAHKIGDHQDGESLNNQRGNLEWATVSQNRRNRKR